jgi:hypothetical protein
VIYLTLPELLHVAGRVLGPEVAVRDYGLLEAALARPQATAFGVAALLNEIPGSQTGSQRPQVPGHTRPRPATTTPAERPVRRYPAPPGRASKVPTKQFAVMAY